MPSTPDNGEFANETTFVTSDKSAETMRLFKGELRNKAAFVLRSDGTEHSLYHKPSRVLADILTEVMQRACLIRADVMQRQLADTFASVICPRTQDDCSIAILARPGKALRTAEQLSVEERQLIADYQEDIRKYADGMDQTRILNVFQHIPVQLARDNKKFQISKVASGARFRDYRGCIEWLNDAGMVNICCCLNFPELPLKGNYDETKYKLYFADSGLLVAMLDEEAQEDLRANKNLGVYKGALYENVVGEALVKAGYQLYYYKRENSTLEQNFFVRTASALIPVEVKAQKGTAKSLRTLITSDKYEDIHCGIKFTAGNVGFRDDIYTFPYFCVFLLKRYLACEQSEKF